MQSTEMVDYTLVREETSKPHIRSCRPEAAVAEPVAGESFWWRNQPENLSEQEIVEIPHKPMYEAAKRFVDISLSGVLLLLCLPVFMVIALAIKATSRGPVLFKQKRIGRGGKEFVIYKFRTMVADAEKQLSTRADLKLQFAENFKIKNDPRITPIGAFLRKTSLDETPQFINVLKGDISLIGPRAIVQAEVSRYGENIHKVLAVTPGLSGWWQVRGRTDTTYTERVQMDLQYVDQRSLALDLRLICETVVSVLRCRGAY
jgi:lipopolysaccharide/colanic/teichoic acid biosynthesis glycosyltransferase